MKIQGDSDQAVSSPKHKSITHLPAWQNLTVGGVAGAIAKTSIAPLERVKILFQISEKRRFSLNKAFRTLLAIGSSEGPRSLWRGNGAQMIRIMPYAGIQFSAHEKYKHLLQVDGEEYLPPLRRFCSGAAAGATAVAATYPLDLIRARLAVQTPLDTTGYHYAGLIDAVRTMWRHEGALAFYKGLSPTLIGIVPYGGLSFFTFETLKSRIIAGQNGDALTTSQRLMCGGLAGLLAQTATYPLDVVRRRMQTEKGNPRYKGVVNALTEIWGREGYRGLYKGVSMNWIKGPIAVGLSFTTFDTLKTHLLDARNSDSE